MAGRGEDVEDVEEEEVFRRESAAQGPIIDGERWLGGDLKEGGILVAGETVPLSTDEK